jgi:hypothetical protein
MNKNLKNTIAIAVLLFSSTIVVGQNTLQLGLLSTFDAYTHIGAVTNDGTVSNDVGSNTGTIAGSGTFGGTKYSNDATTIQCREDLLKIYIHLTDIFVTNPNTPLGPAFGAAAGGDTLDPGVYSVAGTGSVNGNLYLDGGGNSQSVFILKFEGAFSVDAAAKIYMIGGARAENIYWIAEGGITVGAGCQVAGTLIAHPGVISVSTGCTIEGRLLSTEGAISIGTGTTSTAATGNINIPIGFSSSRATASDVDVLGSVEDFAMFSSIAYVSNAATSGFIGDIGTNSAAATSTSVTGFSTSNLIGSVIPVGTTTGQAKTDLASAYTALFALSSTSTIPATTVLGGSNYDTMTAGVYHVPGAGSLNGTITLDGQNDSDAIFVFRFVGAFDVVAQSKVIFKNGARLNNVYWVSGGALSLGTFVYMKGTLMAYGACSAGANANVEGRMLSKTGAVSFSTGVLYTDPEYFAIPTPPAVPVKLLSFTAEAAAGNVDLNWVTASEINNDYFNVEYSKDGSSFTSVIVKVGAGNSTEKTSYTAVHNTSEQGTVYYRLKQTDFDGTTSYSDIVAVDLSAGIDVTFKVSPNPIHNKATITTSEDLHNASLSVYNSHMMVKQINNLSGRSFTFQREDLKTGLYWISLVQDGQVIATKKIVLTD